METNDQARFYVELGNRVRKARRSRNVTQASLADKLGLQRTSITNIEKGIQKILAHTIAEIAYELKIPVASLLPSTESSLATFDVNALMPDAKSRIERDFLAGVLNQTGKK